jgi:hypothetical protein
MLECGFTILSSKLLEFRHYISPRVRKLIVVIGIRFFIHTSSTPRFYTKRLKIVAN